MLISCPWKEAAPPLSGARCWVPRPRISVPYVSPSSPGLCLHRSAQPLICLSPWRQVPGRTRRARLLPMGTTRLWAASPDPSGLVHGLFPEVLTPGLLSAGAPLTGAECGPLPSRYRGRPELCHWSRFPGLTLSLYVVP